MLKWGLFWVAVAAFPHSTYASLCELKKKLASSMVG
jgi:hypothetical protein